MRKKFYIGNFEITIREIIASVSIVAVMLLFGTLIHGKISDYQMDKNEIYNKAIKIKDKDLFQYGMDTNIGNAFVYGKLKSVDTVTYPEIVGDYMYIEKIKEKYTMHTRVVTYTTGSGKTTQTHTKVETYWTWDRVGSEDKKSKEISFCDIIFDSNKINIPQKEYIDTIKESSHIRYQYYGIGTEFTGTIFTCLKDKTITDGTQFYNGLTIEETFNVLESKGGVVVFWVLWILFTCCLIVLFFFLENKWLE